MTLGLNPVAAALTFQARNGRFARDVGKQGYRLWAATDPYGGALWEAERGRNRYGQRAWASRAVGWATIS